MKHYLIIALKLALSAVVTCPVAVLIAVGIFDRGCVFGLCGLEGLVYGGLVIWALLAGAMLWLLVRRAGGQQKARR